MIQGNYEDVIAYVADNSLSIIRESNDEIILSNNQVFDKYEDDTWELR